MNFNTGGTLMIYSFDYDTLLKALPVIQKYRGPITFLSLRGIKDLVLKSTNKPMELLHLQWGNKPGFSTPMDGYTYMFCCINTDIIYHELFSKRITTDISATIIHTNMNDYDWTFIMTSDI